MKHAEFLKGFDACVRHGRPQNKARYNYKGFWIILGEDDQGDWAFKSSVGGDWHYGGKSEGEAQKLAREEIDRYGAPR